jgi:putative transposase
MANSFDSLFSDNKELSKGALNNTANEKPFHAYIETKKTEENFSDITVFSEDQQSDAIHRYSWLKELYRLNIKAFTQNSLKDPISQIQIILGGHAPNWRTLIRWHKSYQNSGRKLISLVPKKSSGNNTLRLSNIADELLQKAMNRLLSVEKPSIADGHKYLEELIYLHNKKTGTKLVAPSYESIRRKFNAITPYDKKLAFEGKAKAKQEFNKVGMILKTSRALECVEVDHTPLDLFVIDEVSYLPLGRPYLTVFKDRHTKSITGYYIGFEPPSIVSVGYGLKNTILPKAWIKTDFPDIKKEWSAYGIPEQLVVDNGSEFWSGGFVNMCLELNIDIKQNPVRKPWLKPSVERFFGTLNRSLFTSTPGKSFSNIFEREDYDPQKYAVLTLAVLKEVLAVWVVEIYQHAPNSRKTDIPELNWNKACEKFPPLKFEGSESKLDFYMGNLHKSTLRKEGITFKYLRYHSDELALIRANLGDHKIQYKYLSDDLSYIYVLNNEEQKYIRVPAVDVEYTENLSLWQHKVHLKYVRKYIGENFNLGDLIEARIKIRNIVEDAVSNKKTKITGKKRASRYIEKDGDYSPKSLINKTKSKKESGPINKDDTDWDFDDSWSVDINDS